MSKTMAVHFASWIFVHFFAVLYAKQQPELTKFCVVYETWTTPANFSYFRLELNVFVTYVTVARF